MKGETLGTGVLSGTSPGGQLQAGAGRTGKPLETRSTNKPGELRVPGADGSGAFWKGRAVPESDAADFKWSAGLRTGRQLGIRVVPAHTQGSSSVTRGAGFAGGNKQNWRNLNTRGESVNANVLGVHTGLPVVPTGGIELTASVYLPVCFKAWINLQRSIYLSFQIMTIQGNAVPSGYRHQETHQPPPLIPTVFPAMGMGLCQLVPTPQLSVSHQEHRTHGEVEVASQGQTTFQSNEQRLIENVCVSSWDRTVMSATSPRPSFLL
uniref:uncharacterized protein LOC118531144 n=1 Tax=Halichoerus grypus TaxID=9711 RepID=UPI001659D266|nr:uncharacterized protein LOC118531144 [Halichoerus grypus]